MQMQSIPGPDFAQNSIANGQISNRWCLYRTYIFSPQKNFWRPTAQPICAFLEEMKAFLRRNKKTNGDVFCHDPSEWYFRRHKCRKKRKITFLRWKVRNGPLGPPWRNLRGECFAPFSLVIIFQGLHKEVHRLIATRQRNKHV